MPNIDLICKDCEKPFYWSEKDQEFYKKRGFQQPKRCYACRQLRKANSVSGEPGDQGWNGPPGKNPRARDYED